MLRKKLIAVAIAAAFVTPIAFAAPNGFYVGGTLGQTNLHVNKSSSTGKVDSKGLGGEIFGGYQFNKYIAAEAGYIQFANTKASGLGLSQTIKTHAFDVVAKGILPINNQFELFGKAGLARISAKSSGDIKGSASATRPIAAIGASYFVTKSLSIDASFTRIFKGGNFDTNGDLAGVGVSYHFA